MLFNCNEIGNFVLQRRWGLIQVLWEKYSSLGEIHHQIILAQGNGVKRSAVCQTQYISRSSQTPADGLQIFFLCLNKKAEFDIRVSVRR